MVTVLAETQKAHQQKPDHISQATTLWSQGKSAGLGMEVGDGVGGDRDTQKLSLVLLGSLLVAKTDSSSQCQACFSLAHRLEGKSSLPKPGRVWVDGWKDVYWGGKEKGGGFLGQMRAADITLALQGIWKEGDTVRSNGAQDKHAEEWFCSLSFQLSLIWNPPAFPTLFSGACLHACCVLCI